MILHALETHRFFFAFLLFFLLNLFIFLNYPRGWQKSRFVRLFFALYYLIGLCALGAIFTVYRHIPYDWVRWLASQVGTYFYDITQWQAILFSLRIVISGLYRLIRPPKSVPKPLKKRRVSRRHIYSVIFVTLSYLITTLSFLNSSNLVLQTYDVHIQKPSDIPALKVALIADLHTGAGCQPNALEKLRQMLVEVDADVLLIGGDVFDETTAQRDADLVCDILSEINPPYGKYCVNGNHEKHTYVDYQSIMEKSGVQLLDDQAVTIGSEIQLIGRSDLLRSASTTEELMETLSIDPEKPMIVLQHRPEGYRQLAQTGCDLVLSGHTHGINFPSWLLTHFVNDQIYGLSKTGEMTGIVTSGVSSWGFHHKLPAKNEVVLLQLTFDPLEDPSP